MNNYYQKLRLKVYQLVLRRLNTRMTFQTKKLSYQKNLLCNQLNNQIFLWKQIKRQERRVLLKKIKNLNFLFLKKIIKIWDMRVLFGLVIQLNRCKSSLIQAQHQFGCFQKFVRMNIVQLKIKSTYNHNLKNLK